MKKQFALRLASITSGVGAAVISASSHAALSQDVTTALDTAKTDGVALATAVLVVIIAIAAFKLLRKGI